MAKPNLDPMASDFLLLRSHDLQKKQKRKGKGKLACVLVYVPQ